MITFRVFKLLQWMYGWGEITPGTKTLLTVVSGFELFIVIWASIGFCIINLPEILMEIKRSKPNEKLSKL